MSNPDFEIVSSALGGMTHGPRALVAALRFYGLEPSRSALDIETALAQGITGNANDPLRRMFNAKLKHWDWEESPKWGNGTPPNSNARRTLIYDLLEVSDKLREVLDEYVEHYEGAWSILVEADNAKGDWYTPSFRDSHNFYFTHLCG